MSYMYPKLDLLLLLSQGRTVLYMMTDKRAGDTPSTVIRIVPCTICLGALICR
jgi:hypothetical protein